jgi:chemotaxis protein MotB
MEEKMTEPKTASPLRTWLWLLAILVLGLGALLIWHQQYSQAQIQAHKATIGDQSQALTAAQTAHAKLSDQITALTSDLETATQGQRDLQARMQAQQQAHEATLAKVRDEAKAVETDLQQRLQGAGDEIAALKADIENLHQAATEAAASHEAHAQQITEDLTEEIIKFRTLLVGSDPDKAAMAANWEHRVQALHAELLKTRQALEAERANLATLDKDLTQAKHANEALKQDLSAATLKLQAADTALTQEHDALTDLRTQGEAAVVAAENKARELADRLDAAILAHTSDKGEAEALIAQLKQEIDAGAAALSSLRGEHENLQGTLATTQEAHAGAQTELDRLSQETAEAQGALSRDLAASKDKIAALSTELDKIRQQGEADQVRAKADLDTLRQQSAADLARAKAEVDALRQQAEADLNRARTGAEAALKHQREALTRLSGLGGRTTQDGILFTLKETETRFLTGKGTLPAGPIPNLDQLAAVLIEFPELKVRIEGYTDSSGRDETNLALSQQRADAIMAALVERGVAAERLTAQGNGETKPIATNDTPAGRSQNRRVEIYVSEP